MLLDLLLLLFQILVALQELRPILLTVILLLYDAVLQALMVDEVPAGQSPKEEHAFGPALQATDVDGFELHLLYGVDRIGYVPGHEGVG